MPKTRRLSDLYVRGVELVLDDGEVDPDTGQPYPPIVLWLQKLNPVEHEKAFRMASAARARHLTLGSDPDSVDYQAYLSDVMDLDFDGLVDLIAGTELNDALLSAEAKVADKDEWKNDSYLQGLRDSWPEIEARLLVEPHDPEANRVRDELSRFNKQVDEEVKELRDDIRSRCSSHDQLELTDMAVNRMLKLQADFAWGREFRAAQLLLGVRQVDDHHQPYFESRAEVDELSKIAIERLYEEYTKMSVEPIEVKGLEETPASLPSVEQPKQEETGVSSSPLAVVQ